MELRHRRNSRDAIPAQLRELLPFGGVEVHEAVHVADAEALHGVGGLGLPLRAEAAATDKQSHEKQQEGGGRHVHGHPSARLVVMPHRRARLHRRRLNGVPCLPASHTLERVDLHRVVVARGRDLPHGVEGCVADAQSAEMLAHAHRRTRITFALHFPQVPHPHEAVQARGREEVRVLRVHGEAADLLLRELVDVRGGSAGGPRVVSADEAVQAGEVEDMRRRRVDLDAGKGLVGFGVGGPIDFRGGGFGEVEEAKGGVVRGGVEVRGVEGGELESCDGAGVEVEGGDGWGGEVIIVELGVFRVEIFCFYRFRLRSWIGGLRGVKDPEVT